MENFKLPVGVQDYLLDECYNKNLVENKLMNEFFLWGYSKVETAQLEFYDSYQTSVASVEQKRLFKMSDLDGSIVVLKPDLTLPTARVVATKFDDELPLKLCYLDNIFDNGINSASTNRVSTQAGVEFYGDGSINADLEIIALAIKSLKKIGLKDFKIDIGQAMFFKGLMNEHGLTDLQAEKVRQVVDKKNLFGVEMVLKEIGASKAVANSINSLVKLFGGIEVLDEAKKIVKNKTSLEALDNLKNLYDGLESYGLSDYISIDLGLVQRISYYTGTIFRGITKNVGVPILAGGRYDNLCSAFGKNINAIGFAIDIKKVLVCLETENCLKQIPAVDVLILSDGDEKFTFEKLEEFRRIGQVASRVSNMTKEQFKIYAKNQKALNAYYIDKTNKIISVLGGKA